MKDSGAFRTIGELSKELNIKPHILRYWEEQFSMLEPLKRAGSRRHYRPEDVDMVKTIHRLLNEEGYTIKGARKYLTSHKSDAVAQESTAARAIAPQPVSAMPMSAHRGEDTSLMLRELKTIRDQLSNALNEA